MEEDTVKVLPNNCLLALLEVKWREEVFTTSYQSLINYLFIVWTVDNWICSCFPHQFLGWRWWNIGSYREKHLQPVRMISP